MKAFRAAILASSSLTLVLVLGGCSVAPIESKGAPEKPRFNKIVLSNDIASTSSTTTFPKDTEKLFVTFDLKDVPIGDKVKGAWVCEESKMAPPNYEIDSATLVIGPGINKGNFSLSKPTKGWPEGSYRVDLYWNDKVAESVKFTISG